MKPWEKVLNAYIRIFEDTFQSVHELTERTDDLRVIGMISSQPIALAHYTGMALLQERMEFPFPVVLSDKAEGDLMHNLDFNAVFAQKRLYWRARPVWDEFEICATCGGTHADGIDPWTKETVAHPWSPKNVYTVYFRFATRSVT